MAAAMRDTASTETAGTEVMGMAITLAIAHTMPCIGSEDGIRSHATCPAVLARYPVIEPASQNL